MLPTLGLVEQDQSTEHRVLDPVAEQWVLGERVADRIGELVSGCLRRLLAPAR